MATFTITYRDCTGLILKRDDHSIKTCCCQTVVLNLQRNLSKYCCNLELSDDLWWWPSITTRNAPSIHSLLLIFIWYLDKRLHHRSQLLCEREDQFDECCAQRELHCGRKGSDLEHRDDGGGQGGARGNLAGTLEVNTSKPDSRLFFSNTDSLLFNHYVVSAMIKNIWGSPLPYRFSVVSYLNNKSHLSKFEQLKNKIKNLTFCAYS
jgi:hypothetical protein